MNRNPDSGRPDKVKLRADVDMVPGQRQAQDRLVAHANLVFPAFASLDVMPIDAAEDYLAVPLHSVGLNEQQQARLFGVFLGFAMTCVEADRANREG